VARHDIVEHQVCHFVVCQIQWRAHCGIELGTNDREDQINSIAQSREHRPEAPSKESFESLTIIQEQKIEQTDQGEQVC